MKAIAHIQTYDPHDCTSAGYDYWLYPDGHLAAESRSCWQGATSGERHITDPGYVDVDDIRPDDPDHDAEARLTAVVDRLDYGPEHTKGWRMVRRGHLIR